MFFNILSNKTILHSIVRCRILLLVLFLEVIVGLLTLIFSKLRTSKRLQRIMQVYETIMTMRYNSRTGTCAVLSKANIHNVM